MFSSELIYLILSFVLFGLTVKLLFQWGSNQSKHRLPPGPPRLPFLGSLLSLLTTGDKRPAVAFQILGKKYGPIFSLKLGSVETIVLNTHAVLTEVAFSDHLMSHLDQNDIWVLVKSNGLNIGLFNAMPELWVPTRTFSNKMLRHHGFNQRSLSSEVIVSQFEEFCDELKSQMSNGQSLVTLTEQFNIIFLNAVWTIMTGKKLSTSNQNTQRQLGIMNEYMRASTFGANLTSIYPQLAQIFPNWSGFAKLQKICKVWRQFLQEAIDEHRADSTYKDEPVNFLDEFFSKIDTQPEGGDLTKTVFTMENLKIVVQDLTLGGTDTSAVLTKLFIRYLIQDPQLQDKLQSEVDSVLGSQLPTEADLSKLVFLQASMHELYRLGSSLPVAPRKILTDWKFKGYDIPKGSVVMLNIWAANRDPSVWQNPETFDPTRFLSEDGHIINAEKVLTFGLGKRRCIGEQVGRTITILAAAMLLQNFTFHLDPQSGPVPVGDYHGITIDIQPFNVIINARNYKPKLQ